MENIENGKNLSWKQLIMKQHTWYDVGGSNMRWTRITFFFGATLRIRSAAHVNVKQQNNIDSLNNWYNIWTKSTENGIQKRIQTFTCRYVYGYCSKQVEGGWKIKFINFPMHTRVRVLLNFKWLCDKYRLTLISLKEDGRFWLFAVCHTLNAWIVEQLINVYHLLKTDANCIVFRRQYFRCLSIFSENSCEWNSWYRRPRRWKFTFRTPINKIPFIWSPHRHSIIH